MADRNPRYARSQVSFRPSVYSSGIQSVQPFSPRWPQGLDYGSWYDPTSWFQDDSVGGTCVDHQGLLGSPGAKVSCAALKSAQTGKQHASYKPDSGMLSDYSLEEAASAGARAALGPATALLPDELPSWAPDFLKSDEQLGREEDEEERKFRRRMIMGLGLAAAVLGGIYIFQQGEARKMAALSGRLV